LAPTPPQDEAFLREVDEELRREQIQQVWKRYGQWIAGAIILFLAAFAAFLFWRAQTEKRAEARGEEMAAALGDVQAGRKTAAGQKLDALIGTDAKGYVTAALFTKAAMASDKGDNKAAAAIYAGIAADQGVAEPFRDAALIRQTLAEYDSLKPQVIIDRLKPLTTPDSPFFATAGELTAIAMLQANRPAEAGRLLAAVANDSKTPASLRARASRLATSLGADVAAMPADKD
jgi:hypothetical protein